MEEKKYIFIVGQNRSGTSLTRNILNSSSQVSIADENNYFGHIFEGIGVKAKLKKELDSKNFPAVVKKIYDDKIYQNFWYKNSAYWKWFTKNVSAEEFLKDLRNNEFSEKELFKYFLQKFNTINAEFIGDKTPDNFRYIDQLMSLSEDVKVIHILRNPVAVYISEVSRRYHKPIKKLPFLLRVFRRLKLLKLFFLINVSIQWNLSYACALENKKRYRMKYKIIEFEKLICNPKKLIKDICVFTSINYSDQMLKQRVVQGVTNPGKQGFDEKAVDRWKNEISIIEKNIILSLTRFTKKRLFDYSDT